MCGRYMLTTTPQALTERFYLDRPPPAAPWTYNVAPQMVLPIILSGEPRQSEPMQWGLVPAWARERTIGDRMINARGETVAVRPAYRSAFRYRRCLVPASGFYEWRQTPQGKQPYFIHLPDEPLFAFAGLWESWHGPNGEELRTFTILTTTANPLVAAIHDRMPVILPRGVQERWLDPAETRVADLLALLQPYSADAMGAYPVARAVNDPRSDGPLLIAPLVVAPAGQGSEP